MTELTETLCLQCGLCCNGVLFADVRHESGDCSPLFAEHGPRVSQPCPAFNFKNCRCAIYAERPARCRKFECKQLRIVRAGEAKAQSALKRIRAAKKLAGEAEQWLAKLGFNDTSLPLHKRFHYCQRAAERGAMPAANFAHLSRLQLVMHHLNVLIAEDFFA